MGGTVLKGAAARLVAPSDLVIVASFDNMKNEEALQYESKLVFFDPKIRMLTTRKEVAGQGNLKKVTW